MGDRGVWIETNITWDGYGGESRLVFIVLNKSKDGAHFLPSRCASFEALRSTPNQSHCSKLDFI